MTFMELLYLHIGLVIAFIVCILALIIMGLISVYSESVYVEPGLYALPLTVGFISLIAGIITGIYAHDYKQAYEREPIMLVSLSNELQYEGHFVFGSGSIEGKDYYFYYYEVEPGTYKKGKKLVDDSVIHETDDVTPRLVVKKEKWEDEVNHFYVPTGTIRIEYTL